jgi:hypothetical protein
MYRLFCGLTSTSVPSMAHSLLLTCTLPARSMNIVRWLVSGKSYPQLSTNNCLHISATVAVNLDLVTTDLCTLCVPLAADPFPIMSDRRCHVG